jgi:predicted Fe-Mo cluster-binding NifX family protein
MLICIPVEEDRGLESPVCQHFGSAARFMFVDTESGTHRSIANGLRHEGHGMCRPLAVVRREPIEGVVAGGLGRRALERLDGDGIRVYRAGPATVGETLAALKAGKLRVMSPEETCQGHEHGHHRHASGSVGDGA